MGFADELRNAPEIKKQEKEKQRIEDNTTFEKILLDLIKEDCKYYAEQGDNHFIAYLVNYIDYVDNKYTDKFSIGSSDEMQIEFYDTKESLLWKRLRKNYFYFINGMYFQNKTYFYPPVFGMSKSNANNLALSLKKQLIDEGLNVEFELKKESERMHYEERFVEYKSKLDKILSGTEGYYKEIPVIDEQMYSFKLNISW